MEPKTSKEDWLDTLRAGSSFGLFEFLPDTLFFAKDANMNMTAGNRAFVERCGFATEEEMVGHSDHDMFSIEMAEKFRADDQTVVDTGKPLVGIVELFPNRIGQPEWFITDKIPLFDKEGSCAGLCGIVRSFERSHSSLQPYLELLPVTEYLKEHCTEKISMTDLASEFGMSLRTLQRRFFATFKTTPQNYITRLRILQACELLVGSRTPITEIALEVGFYDHSAFSKKFAEVLGVSPRQYRNRYLPDKEEQ